MECKVLKWVKSLPNINCQLLLRPSQHRFSVLGPVILPVDWDALGSICDELFLLLGRGSSLVVLPLTVQKQQRRNYISSWF